MAAAARARRRSGTAALPLVLALGLLATSRPAVATTLSHDPVRTARAGEPLTIAVTVEDIAPGLAPRLRYRRRGEQAFRSLAMAAHGTEVWTATVPAADVRGLTLRYYVELAAADGAGDAALSVGSPGRPLSVSLLATEEVASSPAVVRGLSALGALVLAALAVFYAQRRRQERLREELFWFQHLQPLAKLPPLMLSKEIQALTQVRLDHPRLGPTRFSKKVLWARMHRVQKTDSTELYRKCLRFLGVRLDSLASQGAS